MHCNPYYNVQVHTFTDYALEELLLLAKGSDSDILPRCAVVQVQRVLLSSSLHLQPGSPIPAPYPNLISLPLFRLLITFIITVKCY